MVNECRSLLVILGDERSELLGHRNCYVAGQRTLSCKFFNREQIRIALRLNRCGGFFGRDARARERSRQRFSFGGSIPVVGLLKTFSWTPHWFYGSPYGFLATAYVILAFPYMFFSLDAGFRSIDVHTLTEASQSLGARWTTTLFRVILPNIRSAALAGSFLALAIVMGEFTIANLAAFHTFPIFLQYANESQGFPAGALTLLSFAITWGAMASLLLVGRKRGARGAVIAGAR